MINMTINGQQIQAEEGITIIEAAHAIAEAMRCLHCERR